MTLLFRYIFIQFIKNLFAVTACFMTIYLLVDFFEKFDNFLEAGESVSLMAQYFFWRIPFMFEQLSPASILLGGVLTLGLLHYHRELLSLQAGGIDVGRIVMPILAGALLVSFIILASSQWLKPRATLIANRIWHEQVKKEKPKGIERQGRFYYKGKRGIYSFVWSKTVTNQFSSFSYGEWDESYRLVLWLTAETAEWRPEGWILKEGVVKILMDRKDYRVDFFTQKIMALPETPTDFFVPEYLLEEASITGLLTRALQAPPSEDTAWIDFHSRLSYNFLGIPILALALPFFLIICHRWGRDLSLTVPLSCGLALVVFGWWGGAQSLTKAQYLDPFLASWGPHLVFSGLGIILLKRKSQRP